MHDRLALLRSLARQHTSKIVLLVLDGLGDIRSDAQSATPLEEATTPVMDDLARQGALGRLVPASTGITPGSGPGHLGLFGYDPLAPRHDIGRGVLEGLGLGLDLSANAVIARGNFATLDDEGHIVDRRAGRIATSEGRRLIEALRRAVAESPVPGIEVGLRAGEGYRFVLVAESAEPDQPLSAELSDTDPQRVGARPLALQANDAEDEVARSTVSRLDPLWSTLRSALADERQANGFTLRGFSRLPTLPSFSDLYGLTAGAFAGYPLYRGVASACGMTVEPCGKRIGDLVEAVIERWSDYDFFFLHVKQTDQAGEDGDAKTKREVIEEVDRTLPTLLEQKPEVLAITGDHSTPAPMKAHSWHPIPLLVNSPVCGRDATVAFDEQQCLSGGLGTFPSADLMGLLLANAGRLDKFGA